MTKLLLTAFVLLAFGWNSLAHACGGCRPTMAYSDDPADRQQLIGEYREHGQLGVQLLLKHREQLIKGGEDPKSRKMQLLEQAIDAVGGAKYTTASRLFWHADLAAARLQASQENKPILSLRMLGQLTDDLSCANSRFFRTTLYANEEISKLLREKFVLHWQSVRPVPKITIDFGDGRRLERTITGNSAHYILLPDGAVVDCLPGLYGPKAFREKLDALLKVCEAAPPAGDARRQYLVGFHRLEEARINKAWLADLEKLGVDIALPQPKLHVVSQSSAQQPLQVAAVPRAEDAARIARPKSAVESPAIAAVTGRRLALAQVTSEKVWGQLAKLHADESQLDTSSRKLIASQNPTATTAAKITVTKSLAESPLLKMLRGLEESIAFDSIRNEYELHLKLHRWFVDGTAPEELEQLNERVYAELFLTPKSDPWLGLAPADAYSALPNNGVVTAAK